MIHIKTLDTQRLEAINTSSLEAQRSKNLTEQGISSLDPEGQHIVAWSIVHNDREIRAGILARMRDQEQPSEVMLDMSFEEFAELPTVE